MFFLFLNSIEHYTSNWLKKKKIFSWVVYKMQASQQRRKMRREVFASFAPHVLKRKPHASQW